MLRSDAEGGLGRLGFAFIGTPEMTSFASPPAAKQNRNILSRRSVIQTVIAVSQLSVLIDYRLHSLHVKVAWINEFQHQEQKAIA